MADDSSRQRRERLDEAIGAYLKACDARDTPDPQEWLARYPEFQTELAEFLADQARVQAMIPPLHEQATEVSTPPGEASTIGGSGRFATDTTVGPATDEAFLTLGDAASAPDEPADTANGTRVHYFGDYKLLEKIGGGGMGVVYRAHQISLNRLVAVKMIRRSRIGDTDDLRRFQNEAEAVANLDHDHIVPILEVGEHRGRRYFSMKLVPGRSLDKCLAEFAADPRAAATLMVKVARAVHHAHQRGILHRDLKPANILLDADGQPRVTDFGLAKRLESDSHLTHTGDLLGTPSYMAPEQATGQPGAITTATDVYGLGATLYALLAGRAPFVGPSVLATLDQVREQAPEAPSKRNRRISRDLETICLKCLEKDPRRRFYESAAALADDLERYLKGEPILARRTSAVERLGKWARRRPAAAGLIAASVIAALALAAVTVDRISRERKRRVDYFLRIALAEREWQGNNILNAQRILEDCDKDLRRWEWHYLAQTLRMRSLPSPRHECPIFGLAFSPDGKRLVSASMEGGLKHWDGATLRPLPGPDGPRGYAVSVAFSPDGEQLAAVFGNRGDEAPGSILIWRMDTGQKQVLLGHQGINWSVAFSPDGKRLVSTGEDHTIRIWDTASGRQVQQPFKESDNPTSAVFSPDGQYVAYATGSRDQYVLENRPGRITLRSTKTWQVVRTLEKHGGGVNALAFSPSGHELASASSDETVKIWDVRTGSVLHTLKGHTQFVVGVAYSPDGSRLVSASEDGSLRVWDPATGEFLAGFWGHRAMVNCVAFHPDGKHVASGSDDYTIRLWDITEKTGPRTLHTPGRMWVTHLAQNRHGTLLVASSVDGTVTLWDRRTDRPPQTFHEHKGPVWGVAMSPDGRFIASVGGNWRATSSTGEIILRDRRSNRQLRLPSRVCVVWGVAFSPDGRRLATAGGELGRGPCELKIWDTGTGAELHSLKSEGRGVFSVAFSPDGRYLAAATRDKSMVKVWDPASGNLLFTLGGRVESAQEAGLAFSPDSRFLTFPGPQSVRIWDLATRSEAQVLHGHVSWIRQAVFHPKGQRLVTAGDDGTVRIWDLETGQEILPLRGHQGEVSDVIFSADGTQVVSAGRDTTIRIWDATPGGQDQ
jgi:WD40 repeat protein/tRNA A-37 threonylcarbamoyl transferase component Bud32